MLDDAGRGGGIRELKSHSCSVSEGLVFTSREAHKMEGRYRWNRRLTVSTLKLAKPHDDSHSRGSQGNHGQCDFRCRLGCRLFSREQHLFCANTPAALGTSVATMQLLSGVVIMLMCALFGTEGE